MSNVMVWQKLTMRGVGLMFTAVVVASASEEENSDGSLVNAQSCSRAERPTHCSDPHRAKNGPSGEARMDRAKCQ